MFLVSWHEYVGCNHNDMTKCKHDKRSHGCLLGDCLFLEYSWNILIISLGTKLSLKNYLYYTPIF
jgi:hypothetical protein